MMNNTVAFRPSSRRPSLTISCMRGMMIAVLIGFSSIATAGIRVYESESIFVDPAAELRHGRIFAPTPTEFFLLIHRNDIAWVPDPTTGTCPLLIARDGTSNSAKPADVATSVLYGFLSARVPALYMAGEGRIFPSRTSSPAQGIGWTLDELIAPSFQQRETLLLNAIRRMRREARDNRCNSIAIYAVGFSRGAWGLFTSWQSGVSAYRDLPGLANVYMKYVTLIDPVASVGHASSSSQIRDQWGLCPRMPGDTEFRRRLCPLHLTTIIKNQEVRKFFQPNRIHMTSFNPNHPIEELRSWPGPFVPTGRYALAFSGDDLGPFNANTRRSPGLTPTGQEQNTEEIVYQNGAHSAWWKEGQLTASGVMEMGTAFKNMCGPIITCSAHAIHLNEYLATPYPIGSGELGGTERRNTPRDWTFIPTSVQIPVSAAGLQDQIFVAPANETISPPDNSPLTGDPVPGTGGGDGENLFPNDSFIVPPSWGINYSYIEAYVRGTGASPAWGGTWVRSAPSSTSQFISGPGGAETVLAENMQYLMSYLTRDTQCYDIACIQNGNAPVHLGAHDGLNGYSWVGTAPDNIWSTLPTCAPGATMSFSPTACPFGALPSQ